jgi:hypothetical protein
MIVEMVVVVEEGGRGRNMLGRRVIGTAVVVD